MDKKLFLILICLWGTTFLWAEENYYDIYLKISEDFKTVTGTQTVTYYNPNAFPLDTLYFRIRYPEDNPRCKISQIADENRQIFAFESSQTYPGILAIRLMKPFQSGDQINLTMSFSVPVDKKIVTSGRVVSETFLSKGLKKLVAEASQSGSDEHYFYKNRIPSVHFMAALNEDYHTADDTVDKISVDKFQQITRLAYLVANELANRSEPLTWMNK